VHDGDRDLYMGLWELSGVAGELTGSCDGILNE
jgi:hypothetical protein